MKTNKLLVAAVLVIAIGAPIAGFLAEKNGQPMTSTGVRVPFLHGFPAGRIAGQSELASLERADKWLNSPPLTPSALCGKVVLIDFWTYTCINWRRTLPYVRAWAEKYKDQGVGGSAGAAGYGAWDGPLARKPARRHDATGLMFA